MHTQMYVCVYVCIYIYSFLGTEKERESYTRKKQDGKDFIPHFSSLKFSRLFLDVCCHCHRSNGIG